MIIKLRSKLGGNHQHIDVFIGDQEGSLGNAGKLVMNQKEFSLFHEALTCGASQQYFNAVLNASDAVTSESETLPPTPPPVVIVWERDDVVTRWPLED